MNPLISVVSTLLLIGACLAAPQEAPAKEAGDDGSGGNLSSLIDNVFGTRPAEATTSLDELIGAVFKPPAGGSEGSSNTDQKVGTGGTGGSGNGNNFGQPGGSSAGGLGSNNFGGSTDGEGCECVPYYQCQNGTITDNGVGLIDIRVGAGTCSNYLEVCCNPPDVRSPEEKITPKPTTRRGCGARNPEGVGFRITGAKDNEAQFGEFPWMVAILKEEDVGVDGKKLNVYQCGGALIHPRVVLTAAHCINRKDPSILKVRAGEWDTQTKNEIYPHQDRDVQKVIVHETFHSGSLARDFGLLILSQPVEIAENVDIVCLPEYNTRFDFSRCFASGWGKDIFGKEGHYQVILKRVELPVVPHDTCERALRTTRLGKYFKLDQSFICAGGEPGKDTCKGDGGSPLVCPLPNDPRRYAQAGIVAWGIGCGENQIPGVYANVAAARQWIDQQMAFNNLDSSEYQYRAN